MRSFKFSFKHPESNPLVQSITYRTHQIHQQMLSERASVIAKTTPQLNLIRPKVYASSIGYKLNCTKHVHPKNPPEAAIKNSGRLFLQVAKVIVVHG